MSNKNQLGLISSTRDYIFLINSIVIYFLSLFLFKQRRFYSKIVLLFFLYLNCSTNLFAQEKVEFGVFPDSLFNDSTFAKYKNDYVILHKSTDIKIKDDNRSIIVVSNHHIRFKILKESALQATVIGLPFMNYNNLEQIIHIEAQSSDGKNSVKLDTAFIKTIEINARISFKEFQIPGAKVGSVVEYRYQSERRYIEELPEFYFQHEVPVLFAQVSLQEARYLRFNVTKKNEVIPIEYNRVEVDTSTAIKLFTKRRASPIVTHYWTARDIPAFKAEPFVIKANEFRMLLTFNWSEFGVPLQIIEANWDLVSAELSKEKRLEANIEKAKKWAEWGKQKSKTGLSKPRLIDSIFYQVRDKSNFNGILNSFSSVNPDSIFENPIQDAATINQALISALRGAGFKAYPLFTTTFHSTDLLQIYPTKYQFEKLLVYIELANGEFVICDASDKYAHVNMIPSEYVNQKGFLLKGFKQYDWITLVNKSSIFEQQLFLKGELEIDGTLNATVSGEARGYLAKDMRQKMGENQDLSGHFKALLFEKYFQVEIKSVKILTNAADSITFEFAFKLPNAANVIDKGLVFKPLVIGKLGENPFQTENRALPIQFKAEEFLVINAFIKVPKGYSAQIKSGVYDYGFEGAFIKWNQFANKDIDYRFDVRVQQLDYKASSYPNLKNLYDLWQQLSTNEIVIFKL